MLVTISWLHRIIFGRMEHKQIHILENNKMLPARSFIETQIISYVILVGSSVDLDN